MRGNEVNFLQFGPTSISLTVLLLSRDRLSFSKSILRRFIRDCVDRDAAVASPWTVKKPIADKYGVENVMPEETRKGVLEVKNKEIEKRKKVWEDKEGPPSKRQKKLEERGKRFFDNQRPGLKHRSPQLLKVPKSTTRNMSRKNQLDISKNNKPPPSPPLPPFQRRNDTLNILQRI
jgi:hypothetical protein